MRLQPTRTIDYNAKAAVMAEVRNLKRTAEVLVEHGLPSVAMHVQQVAHRLELAVNLPVS